MKTFSSLEAWTGHRERLNAGIGFIPTMGALHEGHLSLARRSILENGCSVACIFVNPVQFDRNHDLENYPRQPDSDIELLSQAGVDAVLLPSFDDIYPDNYRYRVAETDLSSRFCGAHRQGHFEGVMTVVMKLLNIVRPEKAYFGEKDFQQLLLIRDMAKAFFLPVEIIGCPTVRESDGLAMSSRNLMLNDEERQQAPLLHHELVRSQSIDFTRQRLTQHGFDVDYIEEFNGRRLASARLGKTRLIDNVPKP